jgi:hypothetical protein
MQRYCLLLFALMTPTALQAEQPIPVDHSSVHLVFVMRHEAPPKPGDPAATARVGNMLVPTHSIRPVSIKIDDEFVGHAMTGYTSVQPVYVLQSGTYRFEFSCDGFQAVSTNLKVVGTGSKQFLVVKMLPDAE